MSTHRSEGHRGIPVLKHVPLLGALFRADNLSRSRTELVVLITPYIISDERETEGMTRAFRDRLNLERAAPSAALTVESAVSP